MGKYNDAAQLAQSQGVADQGFECRSFDIKVNLYPLHHAAVHNTMPFI